MKKRICSLCLALVMCFLLLSGSVLADATSYSINGVSVSHATSSIGNNCWTYANEIYKKIWGYNFTNDRTASDNMLRNVTSTSELELTTSNLQKYVSAAAIGAVIRTTNKDCLFAKKDSVGHSQIIVQKDGNGFTVFESNIGKGYSREQYYTWKSYVDKWYDANHKYIKYIKWSGAPEYSAEPFVSVNVTHAPSGNLQSGKGYSLEGTISSSHPIAQILAYIGPADGKYDANHLFNKSFSEKDNVRSFNIKRDGIDSTIKFGDLAPGTYTFQVIALNYAGVRTDSIYYHFTVVSSSSSVSYFPKCSSTCTTITKGLQNIGVDSSYSYRAKIAAANSISGYSGTAAQNNELLRLLKNGKLIKP